jgi:hypothetical protein
MTKKYSAGAIGGSLAVIGVWILKEFYNIIMPGEIVAAFGALLTTVVSILIPDNLEAE